MLYCVATCLGNLFMLGNWTPKLKPRKFFFISMARESKLFKKYSQYSQSFVASILQLSKTLLSILMMVEFNFLSKLPRDSLRRQFTFNHLIKQAYQKLIFFWINFPIKPDSFLNKRHHISLWCLPERKGNRVSWLRKSKM